MRSYTADKYQDKGRHTLQDTKNETFVKTNIYYKYEPITATCCYRYFIYEVLQMKDKTITALKVEPMKAPAPCRLTNDLTSLQEAVSIGADTRGLIEVINLDEKTCILCNEEGKLIGLTPNRRLGCDVLCGVFYVVGQDRNGNFTSLASEQQKAYSAYFATPEIISYEEAAEALLSGFYIC